MRQFIAIEEFLWDVVSGDTHRRAGPEQPQGQLVLHGVAAVSYRTETTTVCEHISAVQ